MAKFKVRAGFNDHAGYREIHVIGRRGIKAVLFFSNNVGQWLNVNYYSSPTTLDDCTEYSEALLTAVKIAESISLDHPLFSSSVKEFNINEVVNA